MAQLTDDCFAFGGELLDDLDRIDLMRQFVQHGGLIAEPGADLQHLVAAREFQQVGHQPDDEGLRNRLAMADRQR